ncbi:MAG: argininosuccinate synthase [Armatimonadetes bacterium]|nr:argininosuccinate synthase [Armatimonadota bacterium]
MSTVVLAFSGGLDTSWCIPYLRERGYEVITVTVDVGGVEDLSELSKQLGAVAHFTIDAKQIFFDEVLRWLIAGNVTKGGTYPLCVGAERTLQARLVAEKARQLGAVAIAHGCTAAGNDQIRFEVACRCVAPDLILLAPVRDLTPSRAEQVAFLKEKELPVPAHGAEYSVNSGLWGVTIGGAETTGSECTIPEDKWIRTKNAFAKPLPAKTLSIEFRQGIPTAIDGQKSGPVEIIEILDGIAGAYGIGRGIHLGETILGIKGRVAFEAPAAHVLLMAHRELEKLVLTGRQINLKDSLASAYGEMVHSGLLTEPACRDIEAFFASTQARVTGKVKVCLQTGFAFVEGVSSPYSLHAASRAVYGEAVGEWSSEDAKGFARIYGLPSILHARAGGKS